MLPRHFQYPNFNQKNDTYAHYFFSQDHGDKCLEVSRCLADIEMLREEIETKSQQLEHSQQVSLSCQLQIIKVALGR